MDFKTVLCAQSVVDPDQETGREAAKSTITMTDDVSTITDKPQTRGKAHTLIFDICNHRRRI